MATTVTVNDGYVGKVAGGIIGKAFKEADTIARNLITFLPNVNSKVFLRKISYTDGTVAYTCGFTPEGAVSLTKKELDPVKLMNPISICKEDFRMSWSGDLEGASAWNDNAPSDIMEAIQVEVLSSTAERTDRVIWTGDSANTNEWDGFTTLFGADAGVIKAGNGITSITAAVTEANVIGVLNQVKSAIPVALRRKSIVIAVSPDVADAYDGALIAAGISNGLGGDANTTQKFGRYTLETINGLPDNTIVAYDKTNLVFGTGLAQDHNELRLVDEDEIGLLTGQVRGKMVYNGGCQYYNSEEIVWYLTTA